MNRKMLVSLGTVLLATAILLVLLTLLAQNDSAAPQPARAAPLAAAPAVTEVVPSSAPNDLDTSIVISGADFAISATVLLDDTALDDVGWVSAATLTATVPWGMEPGVYTLTIVNPDGISDTLLNAFTVTQGFGVFTTDGPYGGAIDGIEKKPGIPTTVYALAGEVGLFASENSGEEWELIYSASFMTHLTFDAGDADVMYLGAWDEHDYARSMDGGQTWLTIPQIGFPGDGHGRTYPATHPTDAGTVFMGVGHPQGELPPGKGGVFRSDDYGLTWITKTNGMTNTDVQSIAIHPNDPDKMLAGTWEGSVYASVDGGDNWLLSADLNDRVMGVYFNPYQPLEAWTTGGEGVGEPSTYLYTSTNLTDWTAVIIDPDALGGWFHGWHLTFLTDTIWAGGRSGTYTSTDGGASWTAVPSLQSENNVIAVTPENPQEIYVGNSLGVDKSEDGGQTWQQIIEGLAGQVPRMLATSPLDPDLVFVKTDQSIYRSFNGGHAWQDLGAGGGFHLGDSLAIDPVMPGLAGDKASASGFHLGDSLAIDPYTPSRIYWGRTACDDLFCIDISSDSGETWDLVTTTLPVTFTAGWKDSAVLAIAPHLQIPGRILAGSAVWNDSDESRGLVFASDDYGQNWAYMGPTQPISWIVDIAYDAVDPNLVYMATVGSGQWKSTDGGATWDALPFTLAGNIFDEIAPHPSLSGHLILSTGDQNNNAGLYSSQDAGETWTLLPGNAGSPLVYAPTLPPTLYAYGLIDKGVLRRSVDNGVTWETVEGAPSPTRLATATDGERVVLYVGTPGGMVAQFTPEELLLGAGVYRWTSRLPTARVYLPLILKGYGP